MSTPDVFSKEEQETAEQLRQILEGEAPSEDSEIVQLARLGSLALLASQEWSPRNEASLRREILAMATKKAEGAGAAAPSKSVTRVFAWLGLALPALAALFLTLRAETPSREEESNLSSAQNLQQQAPLPPAAPERRGTAEAFTKSAPAGLPSQTVVLQAQLVVLSERADESEVSKFADAALDQAWRDYRGHLIAQLEER